MNIIIHLLHTIPCAAILSTANATVQEDSTIPQIAAVIRYNILMLTLSHHLYLLLNHLQVVPYSKSVFHLCT